MKKTLFASALLLSAAYSATVTGALNLTSAIGGTVSATTVNNLDTVVSYSFDTGLLTFDAVVQQYSGSSFDAVSGSITHGTQVAVTSGDQHFLTGNTGAIGDHSLIVTIQNVAYNNTSNGFVTPTVSFDGFDSITEFGAGNPNIATQESTALALGNDTTTFASTQQFELFVEAGFGSSTRFRELGINFTVPDTVPEPTSAALLGLGGLALVARRKRA